MLHLVFLCCVAGPCSQSFCSFTWVLSLTSSLTGLWPLIAFVECIGFFAMTEHHHLLHRRQLVFGLHLMLGKDCLPSILWFAAMFGPLLLLAPPPFPPLSSPFRLSCTSLARQERDDLKTFFNSDVQLRRYADPYLIHSSFSLHGSGPAFMTHLCYMHVLGQEDK
jgi:hypothetical protein